MGRENRKLMKLFDVAWTYCVRITLMNDDGYQRSLLGFNWMSMNPVREMSWMSKDLFR